MKRRNDNSSPISQQGSANAQNPAYYASAAAAVARQMSPGINQQFYMDTTMPPPDLINHFSQGVDGIANYANQFCYSTGQPILPHQTINWHQQQNSLNLMYNSNQLPLPPTMPPLPTTLPPTPPPLPPLPPTSPKNKGADHQFHGKKKRKYPDRSKLSINHLTEKQRPITTDSYSTLPTVPPPTQQKKKKSKSPAVQTTDDKSISVNKKARRKPMSIRYPTKKEWDREDAMLAIGLEKEFNNRKRMPMLIIRFPDPELNKEIVKSFSSSIQNVHFQQPSTPRYCFIQLRSDANVEQVRKEIAEIPFGAGHLIVESKYGKNEVNKFEINPEEIDPYTLYIGNLPTTVTVTTVKEKFPLAQRIDIGYAQRMKYTRYAFIRYNNIEDVMDAFRSAFHLVIESRNLIVRFRRQRGNVGFPGEATQQPVNKQDQPAIEVQPEVNETTMNEINTVEASDTLNTSFTSVSTDTNLANINDQIIKEPVNESQNVSNGKIQKQPDEIIDTKVDVLKEAAELLQRTHSKDAPGTSADGVVKTENSLFEDIRVKTEPKDEDDDDDFDYAMDDDIDDDDLEESDDEYDNEKEEDDEDAHRYKNYHWDRLKLQEDHKPDIQALEASLCYKKQSNAKDDDVDSIFSETQNDDDADLDF